MQVEKFLNVTAHLSIIEMIVWMKIIISQLKKFVFYTCFNCMVVCQRSLFSITVRTAGTLVSGEHESLPLMAFFALPPSLFFRTWEGVFRSWISVFGRMPLFSQFWVYRLKVIIFWNQFSCAIWTSYASCSACDSCLPNMVFFAPPPNSVLRIWQYIFRC